MLLTAACCGLLQLIAAWCGGQAAGCAGGVGRRADAVDSLHRISPYCSLLPLIAAYRSSSRRAAARGGAPLLDVLVLVHSGLLHLIAPAYCGARRRAAAHHCWTGWYLYMAAYCTVLHLLNAARGGAPLLDVLVLVHGGAADGGVERREDAVEEVERLPAEVAAQRVLPAVTARVTGP